MNKKGNTKGLNEYNQAKKEETEKIVIDAIDRVRKSGKKFTLQAVCEEAGVSRSYFGKHPELMEIVNKYRETTFSRKKTQDTKDVIIASQRAKIAQLERTIKAFNLNENYREKYEKEVEKNKELEAQIKAIYESKVDLNF